MGAPTISVAVAVEADGRRVRLVVTGRLTVDSQSALHPMIRLGLLLTPATRVVVDLSGAHADDAALEALAGHAREQGTGHPSRQVRFRLPAPMTPADAEELRRLRAEQRPWAAAGAAPHGTVRDIRTAPSRPAPGRRRRDAGTSPPARAAPERTRAAARAAHPATTPARPAGDGPPAGVVLPFRPRSQRPRTPARSGPGARGDAQGP
ncbi:hypothetical protein LQU92_09000 [Kocuria sp. LUK]|uniref:hypothetical protein n=1 Tax=Kocuria TaxID=57493 RepID=UPI001E341946|nr:hypothetical protein [Kocuria sp. LUK]MCD1145372.1 hypothetical protein [Kocuria sp. LUK]